MISLPCNRCAILLLALLLAPLPVPMPGDFASAPAFAAELTASPQAEPAVEGRLATPLNAERAYGYLKQICDLGPRPSGSKAMQRQTNLLAEHFEKLGGQVERQKFRARHPLSGKAVRMANLIVRYRPELKRRVLLCAHYDTRPLPDRDPSPRARRSGRFIGANDGGSGTAVLMELAHLMPQLTGDVGVDLVLFDAEEFVWNDRQPYFLGSEFFARQYRKRKADYYYEWGVLLDMVGDADLQIYYERNSFGWKDTRPLVLALWSTAARLGIDEFKPRSKHLVRDDHTKLHSIGKIPACDIIDFDYPHWHTEQDVPANCSGESLAKVGWVVWEWLKTLDGAKAASEATP